MIQDFEVARGDSYRMVGWRFPFSLDGYAITLAINWGGGGLRLTRAAGDLVVEQQVVDGKPAWLVYWAPTVEQSLAVPLKPLAAYTLRVEQGGDRKTFASGTVTGRGGLRNGA